MKIDDQVLEEISTLIEKYSIEQIDIMEEYLVSIRYLKDSWNERPYENLFDKVYDIKFNTEEILDDLSNRYCNYYEEKADMIRNWPRWEESGSKTSESSVAYSGKSKKDQNTLEKAFNDFNDEFRSTIFTYLRRIKFYNTDEPISFYDPYGITRRGLYKNIMGINVNSPSFEQDILSLTGQHVFFTLDHKNKTELIKSLSLDLANRSNLNSNEFKELSKEISEGKQINKKYISIDDSNEKNAFMLFSRMFSDTLNNNVELINKYNKYYSNSYMQFKTILKNLNF